MGRILIVDQVGIADDADDGPGHDVRVRSI
jgi:hypothetical protein